jgi:hypothetical protein
MSSWLPEQRISSVPGSRVNLLLAGTRLRPRVRIFVSVPQGASQPLNLDQSDQAQNISPGQGIVQFDTSLPTIGSQSLPQ